MAPGGSRTELVLGSVAHGELHRLGVALLDFDLDGPDGVAVPGIAGSHRDSSEETGCVDSAFAQGDRFSGVHVAFRKEKLPRNELGIDVFRARDRDSTDSYARPRVEAPVQARALRSHIDLRAAG